MWGKKLWLFPVALFVLTIGTFVTSYGIAVSNGHVTAGFPYISSTGTVPPESCIFGQLLNISAVLAWATIYIRYRDVEEKLRETDIQACVRMSRINAFALVLGFFTALGASLVANFQVTNQEVVHYIGAIMVFGLGALYSWFQTYITYKLGTKPLWIARLRLALSIIMGIFFISLFVSSPLATKKFTGDNSRKWQPDDGGFVEHIISTSSQWAIAILGMFFFLTFVKEFRDFGLGRPTYYSHSPVQMISSENQGEVTNRRSSDSTSAENHIHDNEVNRSQDGLAIA